MRISDGSMHMTLVLVPGESAWSGETRFTVTESAGVACTGWPAASGIPIAQGEFVDPDGLLLRDENGRMMQDVTIICCELIR